MRVYNQFVNVSVTELNGERDHLSEKYENARTELLHLQGRVSTLAEDLNRMKTEDSSKIPIAVHTSAVNECRRYYNYITAGAIII